MHILNIRPSYEPGVVARFDIEITEHLRLFGLMLTRNQDGKMRTYAPNACGRKAATFHPVLATRITDAAVAALSAGGARHAA
ncbi:hypothetical protein C5L14_23210 [Labrys okinawensis]|uniref:Uncharacterized protein n=1 Tax=Labrys okinawensis TaxID=346911 RepID=A0A2S9Q7M1_9HYPH|nr:hypothetical protein [Labrys okinawensis]PRH85352.1 hypothetical protein C5L14_23210 [Labrys okinawensis]